MPGPHITTAFLMMNESGDGAGIEKNAEAFQLAGCMSRHQ